MKIRLARYGRRFWAVYEDDALLCVTVYKKGARAVIDRIGGRRKVKADNKAARTRRGGADKSGVSE